MCGRGDAHISSLQLYRPSAGIRLVRWGIENQNSNVYLNAEASGPLINLGGAFADHAVTEHCGKASAMVGLQLRRTEPGTQSFLGVRITYDNNGQQQVGYIDEYAKVRDPRP